jgi:hypothetical protein
MLKTKDHRLKAEGGQEFNWAADGIVGHGANGSVLIGLL